MIDLVVWLGILVIVIVVVWFLLSQLDLPEPIRKIVIIVCVVVAAAVAIGFLLQLTGSSGRLPRLR
jgi:hypothetical protein